MRISLKYIDGPISSFGVVRYSSAMSFFDPRTLLVLIGATVTFGALVLWVLARRNSSMPGLSLLPPACVSFAGGSGLFALSQFLPPAVILGLGNSLVALGFGLMLEARRQFFGLRPAIGWLVWRRRSGRRGESCCASSTTTCRNDWLEIRSASARC